MSGLTVTTPSAAPAVGSVKSTTTTTTSSSTHDSSPAAASSSEDDLRRQLRAVLQSLSRREPLEPTYKKLLDKSKLTRRPATIPKNKFYRRIGSRLRERVERYSREMQGKDPFDRIAQRKPLEEAAMRAAFTLREGKDHEQLPLLEATLAATAMHPERKRSLDGMALGLQQGHRKDTTKTSRTIQHSSAVPSSAVAQTEFARQRAELQRQQQQARQWEEARLQREADERRKREEEIANNTNNNRKKNQGESGQRATLHKIIEPVLEKLWDMEFPNLGGTNPFRIVIDRESAPYIAPDYFDVITTPMNLTYIKEKVKKMQYTTLPQFFGDVDLMIDNALKYNADEENPYRIAALELKKKHEKIVKRVWKSIMEKQQSQNK